MSEQYIFKLKPAIRQILASSDLSQVTAKAVRKELVARGEDPDVIKENRPAIDAVISEIYNELTADPTQDDASESSVEVPLTASSSTATAGVEPPSSLPRPLAKKVKRERKPSISPTPKVEHGGGDAAFDDEAYARQLQAQFNAHGSRASRSTGSGSTSARKKKPVVKKKVKRSSETVGSGDEEGTPKKRRSNGNSAFNKELILSEPLAALVGEPRLSRPQTVKRIWDYVKERDLQDASDKRFILCDDNLHSVFNTDRLHMFTMNKILAKHFMDPEEVIIKEDVGVKKDEVY